MIVRRVQVGLQDRDRRGKRLQWVATTLASKHFTNLRNLATATVFPRPAAIIANVHSFWVWSVAKLDEAGGGGVQVWPQDGLSFDTDS